MDSRLAGKIKSFPGEIAKIQSSLQEILDSISEWTADGDYMQLRLLLPRLSFLISMTDILKGEMKSAAELIDDEKDAATGMVIGQQLLVLENLEGQLQSMTDCIKVSVKALETSDRELLASDIIKRSRELEETMRELK